MNTKHGVRSIATLHVSCQPGHHINARVVTGQHCLKWRIVAEIHRGVPSRKPLKVQCHYQLSVVGIETFINVINMYVNDYIYIYI